MKLKDLKRGMKCALRNGGYFIVDNVSEDTIYFIGTCDEGCIQIYAPGDGLVDDDDGFDIVKVYDLDINRGKITDKQWKLIWERETIKEMTIEDIQNELGYKIKVVE